MCLTNGPETVWRRIGIVTGKDYDLEVGVPNTNLEKLEAYQGTGMLKNILNFLLFLDFFSFLFLDLKVGKAEVTRRIGKNFIHTLVIEFSYNKSFACFF